MQQFAIKQLLVFVLANVFVVQGFGWTAIPIASCDDTTKTQREFYQPDKIQTVSLHIAPADQQRMMEALPDCIYVPATFRWRDVTFKNVAVRYKGNSSSNPRQKHKRSFLVRFDKYEKDLRFLGLRRVSFDNGVQFGSLFSEPIITEILQSEGVRAHRCNYAKVYVNDQYQGVYVNVERIDQAFLGRHFPNSKGGLWKNDLGGPGGDLRLVSNDPGRYEKAFEAKNKAAKNRERLVQFIRKINQTPKADFGSMLDSNMEVDNFFRITSVMLLSGAFDQLTGWGPHNFYLYQDTKQNRWHYMPWDLDVGFCEVAFDHVYVLEDWNAAWPVPAGRNSPLLDRVIADPALLSRYRTIAAIVLEKHFEPNRLIAILEKKYALIKPHLKNDPFPHKRVTVPSDKNYDDIVDSMKTFIRKRYATAKQQLQDPGQKPMPVKRRNRNPQGLPPKLAARIQQMQQGAQGLQRKMHRMHELMQQIGPLLEQKKFEQADKLIGEALKLLGQADSK